MKITPDVSFLELQELNTAIYGIANDRIYSNHDFSLKIQRYTTMALKAIRKGRFDQVPWCLVMATSWTMALANRMHIDLDDEIWQRFPGACPYCAGKKCSCKERRLTRATDLPHDDPLRPRTVREYQKMFARIYSANTLDDSKSHLAEEIAEVAEAVQHYSATHRPELFEEIRLELTDVVSCVFAVSNCMPFDLASSIYEFFGEGRCPKCKKPKCRCGFTVATLVARS